MKINIAKSAGFCFGVKRAIQTAAKAASSGRKVYMLGDFVHNAVVVGSLRSSGVEKIKRLGRGRGRTLLIRAHGAQGGTIKNARRAGYNIIDATCPMVKEIHAIAKKLEAGGRTVIIIGDRQHDEVRGIVGQLKKRPLIISARSDLAPKKLRKIKKAGIVVQSTQEEAKVIGIVSRIKRYIDDVAFRNTICNPTKLKQDQAKTLPVSNDVVVVVGSRSSANTKRLYQISRRINRKTYWVNSPGQISKEWFKGARSVGVTAGASTPESSIKEVAGRIKLLNR